MQTAAGIIAEYNPFHLGHRYLIEEARLRTGAEFIIVVMSGNFVQRGEPALFEKSLRARMALMCGADLVLELPAPFATGSAEDFAAGAVSLLGGLGCVSFLAFGSELGQTAPLEDMARRLSHETPLYREHLKKALSQGNAYPKARAIALEAMGMGRQELETVKSPNNLLGIEYLKALHRQNLPIRPVAVQRKGAGYHAGHIPRDGAFASASGIRQAVFRSAQPISGPGEPLEAGFPFPPSVLSQIPEEIRPLYQEGMLLPVFPDDCSALLNYRILSCMEQDVPFREFSDISPELEGRLKEKAFFADSFTGRIRSLKTRQYTYTRISRGLLHLLLTIRGEDMAYYRRHLPKPASETASPDPGCLYARILGFRRQAAPLFKQLKEASVIPLIPKAADAENYLADEAKRLWKQDIFCSHIYPILIRQRYGVSCPNEYSRPLVIL